MKRTPEQVEESFWKRVKKTDKCWEWQGFKTKRMKYGQFSSGDKLESTHRYSWKLKNGEIPVGMYVMHSCDNGSCVNPDHLFLGTPQDNTNDMMGKGRNALCKFSKEQIEQIKKEYIPFKTSYKDLGEKYGVHLSTIHLIVKHKTYKHLDI